VVEEKVEKEVLENLRLLPEEKVVHLAIIATTAQLAKEDVLIVEKMVTGLEIVLMKLEEIDALTVEEVDIWLVNAEKDVERDITHTKEDLGLDLDHLVVLDPQDQDHQENLQDIPDHQKEKDLHLHVNLHLQRRKNRDLLHPVMETRDQDLLHLPKRNRDLLRLKRRNLNQDHLLLINDSAISCIFTDLELINLH